MAFRNPKSSGKRKAATSVVPRNLNEFDTAKWFAELDRLKDKDFLSGGRKQPITPRREACE